MSVVFIGLISGGLCLFSVTNYSGAIEIVLEVVGEEGRGRKAESEKLKAGMVRMEGGRGEWKSGNAVLKSNLHRQRNAIFSCSQ